METGKILHYPELGGAIDQDGWLMTMMLTAWRVWFIHEYKTARQIDITDSDTEFTRWFMPPDWRPGNG